MSATAQMSATDTDDTDYGDYDGLVVEPPRLLEHPLSRRTKLSATAGAVVATVMLLKKGRHH